MKNIIKYNGHYILPLSIKPTKFQKNKLKDIIESENLQYPQNCLASLIILMNESISKNDLINEIRLSVDTFDLFNYGTTLMLVYESFNPTFFEKIKTYL